MTCSSCLKERVFLSEAGLCLPCVHFKKHRKDVEVFIEKAKELTKNGKIVTLKESAGPNCPECQFEEVNGHAPTCSKYIDMYYKIRNEKNAPRKEEIPLISIDDF